MTTEGPLRLAARDAADLTVLATCVQDALVPVSDIAWLQDEARLALAVNRFMWERAEEEEKGDALYHRTHALLRIDHVTAVKSRGYDRGDRGRILSLLSVRPFDGGVDLLFSDGAAIRAETTDFSVTLVDMGQPWPTRWRPGHPEDDA